MNILDALDNSDLFAGQFQPAESWSAWRAVLAALFALPMTEPQLDTYRRHTGREVQPSAPARECWLAIGRRGGKSRVAALVAVFLAAFRKYSLAPGETGVLMVIAGDRRQARVVLRYINGLLDSPILSQMVARRLREAIVLTNGVTIEVHTASFRSTRGYTVVGAVLDEISFWPADEASANPDSEILAAIRPGMATVPGSLIVAISSPYARKGELYRALERHHARDGDPVLTWMADTLTMNPSADPAEIARAFEEDEVSAWSEYGRGGEVRFRTDVESFISREAALAVVEAGARERGAVAGMFYSAFCDPAGGSGGDSMTLAVAHHEGGAGVLDCLREVRPPFSPEAVVREFAQVLRGYGVSRVRGDAYAGSWPSEGFSKMGVLYEPSAEPKARIYQSLLPLLNSRRVRLLDDPRLQAQLLALERRTARGGRDSIDHPPRGHDDVVNAAAGALVEAAGHDGDLGLTLGWPTETPVTEVEPAQRSYLNRIAWR